MNEENNLDNNTLVVDRNPLAYATETTGYGLDTTEDVFSTESLANLTQAENLEIQADTQQLVFIDSTVEDIQTLTDNISGATEVIVLNNDSDELLQISEHLSNYEELDAVHIVSHGETGQLSFGNATLNSETLPEYEEVIEEWSLALNADADLLLYGCDVTLNGQGHSFVQQLSQITDADIAASIDLTGSGGDWELETAVGEIETTSAFNDEIARVYEHTLVDAGIDIGVGGGGGGFDSGGGFAGGGDRPVDGNNDSDGEDDDDDNNNNGGGSGQPSFRTDDLVDAEYYLSRNPDVAQNGASAEQHYFNNGRLEGRYPNPTFEAFAISPKVLVGSVDFAEGDYQNFKTSANDLAAQNNQIASIGIPIYLYKILEGAIVLGIGIIGLDTLNEADSLREAVKDSDSDIFITPPPTTGPLPPEQTPSGISRSEAELEFIKTPPLDFTDVTKVNLDSFPNGEKFIDFIEDGKFEFPSEQEDKFFRPSNENRDRIDKSDLWGSQYFSIEPFSEGIDQPTRDAIGLSNVDEVLDSASREAKAGAESSRGLQGLQKKIDRGNSAYAGLSKTEEAVDQVISETLGSSNTNPVVRTGTNRNQKNYVDVFNSATGRGVRIIDGQFDTFVNLN